MQDSFGARMRQHRERQGITIAFIADRTKLKASLIEGFERDDISGWPAGTSAAPGCGSYAEAIDLDPQVVTREFLEQHPEPVVEVEPVEDCRRACAAWSARRSGSAAASCRGAGVAGQCPDHRYLGPRRPGADAAARGRRPPLLVADSLRFCRRRRRRAPHAPNPPVHGRRGRFSLPPPTSAPSSAAWSMATRSSRCCGRRRR